MTNIHGPIRSPADLLRKKAQTLKNDLAEKREKLQYMQEQVGDLEREIAENTKTAKELAAAADILEPQSDTVREELSESTG